jgi:hypothetical protein
MSERRRPDPRRRPLPLQKSRRIQAENQARGDRARTHLERTRRRHRSVLEREARSARRGLRAPGDGAGLRRAIAVCAFVASVGIGAAFAWPALDVAGVLGTGEPMRIERIAVQGNRLLSSRDVADATGVEPGQVGGEVEPLDVGERLRAHPWIRDAQVMRLPTGKLLISIDERAPAALLAPSDATGEAAAWRFVDGTGTPFARVGDPGPSRLDEQDAAAWPRLRGGEGLDDGQAHPELAAALALLRHLRAGGLAELLGAEGALELRLPEPSDARGWVIEPGPGRPIVILGHDRLLERVDRLEALLRSQIAELRGAREIDLRFADRAILRSGSASS